MMILKEYYRTLLKIEKVQYYLKNQKWIGHQYKKELVKFNSRVRNLM